MKLKKIRLSTNFAVLISHRGVAALETTKTSNWTKVAFWAVIGIVFLVADNLNGSEQG